MGSSGGSAGGSTGIGGCWWVPAKGGHGRAASIDPRCAIRRMRWDAVRSARRGDAVRIACATAAKLDDATLARPRAEVINHRQALLTQRFECDRLPTGAMRHLCRETMQPHPARTRAHSDGTARGDLCVCARARAPRARVWWGSSGSMQQRRTSVAADTRGRRKVAAPNAAREGTELLASSASHTQP